jgi:hypothetical protein
MMENPRSVPSTAGSDAELYELLQIPDANPAVELRADFQSMRAGFPVPLHRRREVEEAVREILADHEAAA